MLCMTIAAHLHTTLSIFLPVSCKQKTPKAPSSLGRGRVFLLSYVGCTTQTSTDVRSGQSRARDTRHSQTFAPHMYHTLQSPIGSELQSKETSPCMFELTLRRPLYTVPYTGQTIRGRARPLYCSTRALGHSRVHERAQWRRRGGRYSPPPTACHLPE